MPRQDIIQTVTGACFVKPHGSCQLCALQSSPKAHATSHVHPVRRGLVPSALHDLVTARRKVKALMKAHRDDPNTPASQHAVWNARQLALKVSANALYGFTGAPASPLCCGPLAESCIFHGATLCQTARVFIETEGASALLHGVAGGPRLHRPPRVIYGQVCGCVCVTRVKVGGQPSPILLLLSSAPMLLAELLDRRTA